MKAVYQVLVLSPEALKVFEVRASHCKAKARLWVRHVPWFLCWENLHLLSWAQRTAGHKA